MINVWELLMPKDFPAAVYYLLKQVGNISLSLTFVPYWRNAVNGSFRQYVISSAFTKGLKCPSVVFSKRNPMKHT